MERLGWVGALIVAVALVVAASVLWLQTRDDLEDSRELLAASRAEVERLSADLAGERTRSFELANELTASQLSLQDANSYLAILGDDLATAQTNIHAAQGRLVEADNRIDALVASRDALEQLLSGTQDELYTLASKHQVLEQSVGNLEQVKEQIGSLDSTITSRNTTIGELDSQIVELRDEIEALKVAREPWMLETRTSGLMCTGSMEPALTCLDEVTWLMNSYPEDIAEGVIISFDIGACRDESKWIAHRVEKVKVEDGIYYYWPKGDNNSQADGCWVPFSHVNGYAINVRRNAHPENAELRNMVVEAQADMDRAMAIHNATKSRYCRAAPTSGTSVGAEHDGKPCYFTSQEWDELDHLYQVVYLGAYRYWECTLDSARNATHSPDGRAPIYQTCSHPGPMS
ncbi:MAG: hypothetical protein J4G01_09180 [Dehalococcoidia bacterium]|nr:hypothetical protein [Dehalococcoidia bacterium]